MSKGRVKYKAGDQIHFIITDEFVDISNSFRLFCDNNNINFSGAIREAMVKWLKEKVTRERLVAQIEDGPSMKMLSDMYERSIMKEVVDE